MDNIEQLKLDNEKLNARLAKAVEVFKEQKANIENLTKEKEDLQAKYDEVFNVSKELETENAKLKYDLNTIQTLYEETSIEVGELRGANKELVEQNTKSINRIEELKEVYAKSLADLHDLQENSSNNEHDKLEFEEKYNKIKDQYNAVLKSAKEQEEQIEKYKAIEENYRKLKELYNSTINANDEANKKLNTSLNEYELKLQNSEAAYEKIRIDYKKLSEEKQQLELQNTNYLERLTSLEKAAQTSKAEYDELVKFKEEICKLVETKPAHKRVEHGENHRMGSVHELPGFQM